MSLVDKLLQAFFYIGGSRRAAHRTAQANRPPRHIQQDLMWAAEERRKRRRAKRLHWQLEYETTYYNATRVLTGNGDWNNSLGGFLQHVEKVA